jgi:hypothetical protein
MLEPRSVLNGFVPIAHGISTPPTFPTVTICAFRANAPSHIPTASVTPHLRTNQARILQELDGNIHIKKEIEKEELIRITVVSQHGSSERTFRREGHVNQAFLIIVNHSLDTVDHDGEL